MAEVTNDRIYELLDKMRLELKGDIRDLRLQFDSLEAGRLTRLEGRMRDFEVTTAQKEAKMDTNQAVLSTKVLVIWGIGSGLFFVLSEVIVNYLVK